MTGSAFERIWELAKPYLDTRENLIHTEISVAFARTLLDRVECDPDLRREILEIIDGHDSRTYPVSLNEGIVKDADKLWRTTRGVSRSTPGDLEKHCWRGSSGCSHT